LEVTAENEGAIRLYRRLGFATVKTVFKVAEAAYS
jgi:ribosomal protein S18 acetylase RimI-like enzyme